MLRYLCGWECVCREARDGAYVMYEEEMTDRKKEPMRKLPHTRVNCAKFSIRNFGCRWILAEEGYLGG